MKPTEYMNDEELVERLDTVDLTLLDAAKLALGEPLDLRLLDPSRLADLADVFDQRVGPEYGAVEAYRNLVGKRRHPLERDVQDCCSCRAFFSS